MEVNRRGFLRLSGAAAAGVAFAGVDFDLSPIESYAQQLRIVGAKETTTICPYCAVGCGIIVNSQEGKVINTEGDPDHPISQGALCSKGSALFQVPNNERRITQVMYRAPFSTSWEFKSWDWALDRIAKRIKETRDASFLIKNAKGQTVNRIEKIASVGSAALDNEECFLYRKFLTSLGLVYIEHQARV